MEKLDFSIKRISPREPHLIDQMLDVFAAVFGDAATYSGQRPSRDYTRRVLQSESFVGLVALHGAQVIGGLTAYELVKCERECSGFHIHELAVEERHRRVGVATGLILALKPIAAARGAKLIFIQTNYGDDPAIALYTKLGKREDILHFEIAV